MYVRHIAAIIRAPPVLAAYSREKSPRVSQSPMNVLPSRRTRRIGSSVGSSEAKSSKPLSAKNVLALTNLPSTLTRILSASVGLDQVALGRLLYLDLTDVELLNLEVCEFGCEGLDEQHRRRDIALVDVLAALGQELLDECLWGGIAGEESEGGEEEAVGGLSLPESRSGCCRHHRHHRHRRHRQRPA